MSTTVKEHEQAATLERLYTESEIRNAWANFCFVLDGDGREPGSVQAMIRAIFADDGIFEGVTPTDEVLFRWRMHGSSGELTALDGLTVAELLARSKAHAAARGLHTHEGHARHYPISIVFDTVTATRVSTRTLVLRLGAGEHEELVYIDQWVRTKRGWRKQHSRLRLPF